MSYAPKYRDIFDYLSSPDLPTSAEPAVVFGRNDPLVAEALGDLAIEDLVSIAVISGGIGKDSGNLLDLGFGSEAAYVGAELRADSVRRGYWLPQTILEEKASNGGENARKSIDGLKDFGIIMDSMTAVAHATSSRRLAETLKFEAAKKLGNTPVVHRKPSNYNFDATNPADQDEAAQEFLRLAYWPTKGLLGPQADIPEDLIDFVTETHGDAPKPVAGWQSTILRLLPKRSRQNIINIASRHGRK